jgi:replicative DNA helicase
MTSAEFLQQDYRLSWYVQHILVAGQPCVLGGPKKSLKTNILIDLALSLGSATPFLGKFKVYNRVRTAFISGESGGGTIRETALRIAASKGIELADADVLWDLRLPRLGNDAELAELVRGIKAKGVKVLIIDPLYLSLLPEAGGADAANLYQMGPLLCRVGKACLDAGVTPILAHHAKKNRLNNYDPLDLDDLAFSGIAEYSRQWLLVNRASSYDADKPHRLHLVAGGSVGHGGLWTLSIDEGKLDENFQGRVWNVEVLTASESRDNKAVQQAMKEREKEVADEAKLLGTLDSIDPDRVGVSYTHAREVSGLARRMPATLERLKTQNLLEEIKDFRTLSGRPARGIRRSPKETSGTSG